MFDLLARKEKATRGDIHELFTKDKELRAQLAALLKAGGDGQRNYEEISAALKKLEAELRALIAQTAQQGRNYTDHRIEELLLKLRELERALERGMKSELKRFERDVLVFMESAHGGAGGDGNSDAAVGKIHFRCLSCDQHVGNLQGPSSLLYARAVGGSAPINPNATNMQIDKGKELYLNGRDGSVYKGREPTQVTIAPGDLSRPSQFNVHYSDRMVTTNPRHHTILDQKTVSYNHNHAHTTPQRLPLTRPHTAGEIAPPGRLGQLAQPDSLPPTRPSTRGGGRAAISASRSQVREEEKTPLREQLQVPG